MRVVITIHIFDGGVEAFPSVGCLCRVKGWSDSSFRKKIAGGGRFVYNEYRIEIVEVYNDRKPKGGVYSTLSKK